MQKNRQRLKHICITTFLLCSVFLSSPGCGAESGSQEEETFVVIDRPKEETVYMAVAASYADIAKTVKITCIYRHTDEYDITTSMIGKKIDEIYVKQGDKVAKGQLIARLAGSDIEESIEELEYKIARNELLLEHLVSEENETLSYRWWTFIYQSSQSEADREDLDKSLDSIRQSYRYQREDYEDTIMLDRQQLEIYRQDLDQYFIRADMAGEISRVNDFLIGQVLTKETIIAQIFDSSQCIFEASSSEYAYCFHEEEPVELSINTAGTTLILNVTPLDMENWEDKMFFAIPPLENTAIPLGAYGSIVVTADSRQHVLTVPNEAVFSANNGGKYVYVQGENNLREIRWVETGLRGNDLTEIISGLTEGESVLLK